jgi:hypothetical protein
MTVTYPPQTKTKHLRPALPPNAPTPRLRADAAIVEAIAAFRSLARSAGMIGVFLLFMSSKSLSGLEQYFWPLFMPITLGILAASMSLSFAAVDFTLPASARSISAESAKTSAGLVFGDGFVGRLLPGRLCWDWAFCSIIRHWASKLTKRQPYPVQF